MLRILLLGLAAIGAVHAQIQGRVIDRSGAGVSGAVVGIAGAGVVKTNVQGEFTLNGVPAGRHRLICRHEDYATVRMPGVEAPAGNLIIRMRARGGGGTAQRAARPAQTAGEEAGARELTETPLEGRDLRDRAFLVPGVSRRAQGGAGGNFQVNGARSEGTNHFLDGFSNYNGKGGEVMPRPPMDAIGEFRVQVSGFLPEYGRAAGGVISTTLRTGTNQLHGALFEFLRNDAFDARGFFQPFKPAFHRNQFGAVANGPVSIPGLYTGRDKTYFLASWESQRQSQESTRVARIPTLAEREGDFTQTPGVALLKDPLSNQACDETAVAGCFPGRRIPASRWSDAAARIASFYPAPNVAGINNLFMAAKDVDSWDSFVWKVDHRIGPRSALAARWMARWNKISNPFSGSDVARFGARERQSHHLAGLTWTHSLAPRWTLEARLGMARNTEQNVHLLQGHDLSAEFGIPGTAASPEFQGFPRFTVRDYAALGNAAALPTNTAYTAPEAAVAATWAHSRHLVRAGYQTLWIRDYQGVNSNVRGTFNFLGRWTNAPFGDFLLGLLNNSSRLLGTTKTYLSTSTHGLFVQDEYRATNRLQFQIGARWDRMLPFQEKYNRLTNYVPELGLLAIADTATVKDFATLVEQNGLTGMVGLAAGYGLPAGLIHTSRRNLAPRLGFAYRPERLVHRVRGGYGIYYSTVMTGETRGDLAVTFPFVISHNFQRNANRPNDLTLANPFPANRSNIEGVNNTAGYQLHAPTPYLQSWNLAVERELEGGFHFEIVYLGSKGTHLGRRYNLNQPFRIPELRQGTSFPRPYAGFADIQFYSFGSNSSYNAGVVSLRKALGNGLLLRVNYTYSKSIDDASQLRDRSDGGYAGAQDARNLWLERGRSDWDTGHTGAFLLSWQAPWKNWLGRGVHLSSSARMYTGQPFTPISSNVDLNQGEANRPDRVANGRLEHRTPERWFDLDAFPPVPRGAYRMGTSGRNILDGPGMYVVHIGVRKGFAIRDAGVVQLRFEVFNATNHTNFQLPETAANAPQAGVIRKAADGRNAMVGVKFVF